MSYGEIASRNSNGNSIVLKSDSNGSRINFTNDGENWNNLIPQHNKSGFIALLDDSYTKAESDGRYQIKSTALEKSDVTSSIGHSTILVSSQKLVSDVNNKLIGVDQSWKHMHTTGERKANIVYTNNNSRPIMISITYRQESGNNVAALTLKINGYQIARQVSRYSEAEKAANISMIIPAGSTYEVTDTAGALYLWSELS
ncbi:hypothetical protein KUA03_04535 [Proteus mirabilis]|uniref:hypothetical protein n=1 Tax=Proteus mirabilis TaxID=584 RepID=UPI002182179C|nr:hypothetical protein [Proteus mirabilis]MCT0069328.1 hypothetical protein [Proteus mirabilis]